MKPEPRYGHFPWWPEDGDDWVHPEDVPLARELIPSQRVFRREGETGPFILLHYGDQTLRVKRTLWRELKGVGFEVGDWVEVLSRGMLNTPRTAVVRDVLWNERKKRIEYQVTESDGPIHNRYTAEDLRPVEPTG